MIHDFNKPVDRFGTNCVKHDEMPDRDTIALWVADMDFETAPVIRQALQKRMEHGCYGYTFVPESYYQASIDWFGRRHGWQTQREWYIYTSGVVPALSAIIKGVQIHQNHNQDDKMKVLVQTPVYNCFFSCIRNSGCEMAENRLVYSGNTYTIDWEDFEAKCADPAVKIFILCNPHNPAGRVWSREELVRMGEICQRHDVFVIADEIHCEFTNDVAYTPFASVSDAQCAVCVSPSKAFNIAGLQIANIIVQNDSMRQAIDRAININEVCDVNPFGVIALQAAYTSEGEEWLTQLNEYIYGNYRFVCEYIAEHLPALHPVRLEGTYLLWIDVSATGMTGTEYTQMLMEKAKVCVNDGAMYGAEAGRDFIRVNLATQRARLQEALQRIAAVCL